jgi:predicted ATP-grasp superfamily ATP-dependent carboligase
VRILIVGFSTRAIAESAVRGGYNIVTLDYFGDRDQKELVENYSLMRDFQLDFSAEVLPEASRSLNFQAVAYTSSLENHPDVVEDLARGHILLGNSPSTLRGVRDWSHLRSVCRQENIAHPVTLLPGEEEQAKRSGRWLSKPERSGGGHEIGFWKGGMLGKGRILQEWIAGETCSAAFVADGRRCVLLGLTEQLIGRQELGARGFTWCGNILPLNLPTPEIETVVESVREMVEKLTRFFGLRGVNGVDFVLGRDEGGYPVPYLVEVNPRYTASMELVEWAYGINVFDLHIRFFNEELPSFHAPPFAAEGRPRPGFYGKGIVYAREDVVMPDTAGWRDQERRDIPFPGERIAARHPICTVLAKGRTRDECWHRLLAAAEAVWQEVEKPALDRERRQWCLSSS